MRAGGRAAIVGNGAAAVECFKALRRYGFAGGIDVYAAGELPVYNPMLTSYYAAGKIPHAMMFPYGDNFDVFDEYGVTLHKNTPIAKVSAQERTLTGAGGEAFAYDQCLIATGARVFVPPFPGWDGARVFTLRTVEDAVRLRAAMASGPKKALVVGASMVGIKLVELFRKAGVACCLADMAPHIFPLAAGEACARFIERRLEDSGVRLRFSAAIERCEETEDGIRAWFAGSGEPEEADLLLMCIGVRANTGLVDPGEVAVQQGILVNERMETSAAGLWAAGDVAQGLNLLSGEKQVIGLWASARNQGRTAGANMAGALGAAGRPALLPGSAGQPVEYRGEVLHNITHFMGMDFVGIGEVREFDESVGSESDCHYARLYYKEGRLCGANFLDLFEDCGVVKNLLVKSLAESGCEGEAVGNGVLQKHLFENLLAQMRG